MPITLTKDSSGAPAVDLSKLRDTHPSLVKRAEKAGISLSKRGLDGIRAQVAMLVDHSGSMYGDYRSGAVQTLVERALGFALQVDADGVVPVIPFDNRVWPSVDVTVDNYQGVVDRDIWRANQMGGTDMAEPLRTLGKIADASDLPVFGIVIGDGSPSDRTATTKAVCELASKALFIKFLAVRPVDYLQELDDLPSGSNGLFRRGNARLLDNVDAKFLTDPASMSDLAFADAMVDEWDSWITAARGAGVLA